MTANKYFMKSLLIVCLSLCGIISFYLSSKYFSADPDFLNSSIVWSEIKSHGFKVLKEWHPTVDNWYLSIYPLHFLMFAIFGNPSVLMLKILAAIQISACALLATLIVYKKTKNPLSFFLLILLSCLSYYSYTIGFAFHLFSHNSVNLYGILCILIYVYCGDKFSSCISICLISLASSISDPWFMVAYTLPFFILSIFDKLTKKQNSWKFILAHLVTLIIFFSHLIQHVLDVPVTQFEIANVNVAFNNLKYFMIDSGWMNNIFFMKSEWAYVSSSALMILVTFISIFFGKKLDSLNLLLIFSLLGVSSSFIIGNPEKDEISARFLANIIYVVPIILCVNLNKISMPFSLSFLGLCFISSIYSHSINSKNNYDNEVLEQIKFMEENGLNFGYGAYWGTRSSSVTWMSNGEITIIPFVVNHSDGKINWKTHRSQIFDHWYEPAHKKTFIAVIQDQETCPSVEKCMAGIQSQHGVPDNLYKYKGITFLVYKNGITFN